MTLQELEAEMDRCISGLRMAHEAAVCVKVAHWIGHREGEQPSDVRKLDREHQGAVDLAFRTGASWFVLEHTRIESFAGQFDMHEGRRSITLPDSEEDRHTMRVQRVGRALSAKLPKLETWKNRLKAEQGQCRSVLLLEDSDFVLSNPERVLRAVTDALASCAEPVPDEIHLVGTNSVSVFERLTRPSVISLMLLKEGNRIGESIPLMGPFIWEDKDRSWKPSHAAEG